MAHLRRHFSTLKTAVALPPTDVTHPPIGHHSHGIITRVDGQWLVNGAPVADYRTALAVAQGRA